MWVAWWRKLPFFPRQQVGLWSPMMPFNRRAECLACFEQMSVLHAWVPGEYSLVILPRGLHPERDTTIEPGSTPGDELPDTE